MKNKTKTVVLKVTKYLTGHDGNGQMNKEVTSVTLPYDTREYYNFLKNAKRVGFDKVEFKDAFIEGEEITKEQIKEIEESVNSLLVVKEVKSDNLKDTLDAQNKIIEEQKKMIEKLLSKSDESDDDDDDKAVAVEYYKEAFGKKPHHSWSTEKILEKIEELKQN